VTLIAVTGATGFVGQSLIDRALAEGLAVRALARREQPKRKNTLPSALADDDRLATPVFTPPLDHRPLITLPIRSRSVSGTNEALHQGRLVA